MPDFSSNNTATGKIGSIESFLETSAPQETKEENTPDAIDALMEEGEKVVEQVKEDGPVKIKPEASPSTKTTEELPLVVSKEKEEDIIEDIVLKDSKGIDYKKVLTTLAEKGVVDKIDAFETDEGDIPFDEMDIDEDTFATIIEQQYEAVKEKAAKDKISLAGNSDFTKKLIEIEKNGGSVQDALKIYQEVQNPLENIDLAKESDQQAVVYMHYKQKGLSDEEALTFIKSYKSSGVLEEKATEFKEVIEEKANKDLERINQEAEIRKQQHKEALKTYKTNLTETFKNFDLNSKFKSKLIDVATKPDKNGQFELDNMYNTVRKDPTKVAELTLFLTDPDAFYKYVTTKASNENKLQTFKRLKLTSKRGKSPVEIDAAGGESKNSNFIDLTEI